MKKKKKKENKPKEKPINPATQTSEGSPTPPKDPPGHGNG